MKIDEKIIDHLSNLTKLEFLDGEKKEIMDDLNKMLSFVDALNEVDTKGVEPLIHMTHRINNLREDTAKEGVTQEEGLRNAPNKDSYYFKVPKVIDNQ